MRARRYQLRKEAVGIVRHHHPWVFRDHLSSAANVFGDGDRLRLYDGANHIVGHGVYAADGAIAIRVLRTGAHAPDAAWLRGRLVAALAKRKELAARTDGIRLVHGESDGIPAVVADRFGDAIVVSSYATGFDGIARYVARAFVAIARGQWPVEATSATSAGKESAVSTTGTTRGGATRDGATSDSATPGGATSAGATTRRSSTGTNAIASTNTSAASDTAPSAADLAAIVGPARHVVVRPARRRHAPSPPVRVIAGRSAESNNLGAPISAESNVSAQPLARFTEDGLAFSVNLESGQKTGAYLDLRGLRHVVAAMPLTGKRVLNLFAYTGMTGRAAEAAGASSIVQVDASEPALAFARAHHVTDPAKHELIVADVFERLASLISGARFDLVVVDPPAMTSRAAQIPKVLASYRKLYRAAAPLVAPGGVLVAACCTSRIDRDAFRDTVKKALGDGFAHERDLPAEPDHPVGFPQADYLKIGLWRSTTR